MNVLVLWRVHPSSAFTEMFTTSVTPWSLSYSMISCLSHKRSSLHLTTPLQMLSVLWGEHVTGVWARCESLCSCSLWLLLLASTRIAPLCSRLTVFRLPIWAFRALPTRNGESFARALSESVSESMTNHVGKKTIISLSLWCRWFVGYCVRCFHGLKRNSSRCPPPTMERQRDVTIPREREGLAGQGPLHRRTLWVSTAEETGIVGRESAPHLPRANTWS